MGGYGTLLPVTGLAVIGGLLAAPTFAVIAIAMVAIGIVVLRFGKPARHPKD